MNKSKPVSEMMKELSAVAAFAQQPYTLPPASIEEENRKIGKEENSEIVKLENRKRGKLESSEIGKEENRRIGKMNEDLFDLYGEAYRKDSFFFTDDEFNAIFDLKVSVSRSEDIKIRKSDLARIAFKMLMDDYQKQGENSFLITILRKRKPLKK